MKHKALALVAGMVLCSTTAVAADFSGTWTVSSTIIAHGHVVGTATPVCHFAQMGSQLSGACKGPNAQGPIMGTVRGGAFSFQWSTSATTPYGLSGVQSFNGSLGPDGVMRGSSRSSNMAGRGVFTAQRL